MRMGHLNVYSDTVISKFLNYIYSHIYFLAYVLNLQLAPKSG